MKLSLKAVLFFASFLCLLFGPLSSKADTIYITPDTGFQWTQTYHPPREPTESEIAEWVGYTGTLQWLYKAEVGGGEEGFYAESYQTVFSYEPDDPHDATISYVVGPYISGKPLYLLVKDGAANPTLYIFDLRNISGASWNGQDPIVMTGFWLDKGAISNVAILGVPEPSTLLLLGAGLLGLGIVTRRKFKG